MNSWMIPSSILVLLYLSQLKVNADRAAECSKDSLAVYEVLFETLWDRRDFPKHYPEWRPPASWSKLLGFSHGSSFNLFRRGETASTGLKEFAETAQTDLLDLHTQGAKNVLDAFNAAPISSGVGKSRVAFSADGNHSKVSLVAKILPSPDWFVGLDSYDLCQNGSWLEYIHLEAGPLDAGTDNGLTFTSPNWPSEPQEKVHEITSQFPDHPGSSFNYPQLEALPALAQFTFTKQREYTLKKNFEAADYSGKFDENSFISFIIDNKTKTKQMKKSDKDLERFKNRVEYVTSNKEDPKMVPNFDSSPNDTNSPLNHNHVNSINHLRNRKRDFANYSYKKHLHKHKKQFRQKHRPTTTPTPPTRTTQVTEPGLRNYYTTTTPISLEKPQKYESKEEGRVKTGQSRHIRRFARRGRKRIPTGDAMAVIDDIVKNYQRDHRRELKKRRREERRRRREQIKKIRPPRDCRVSEWSSWSPCSKTCGIGEQTRTRRMIKRARRGGKPCPPLEETTWCGSARACQRTYFNWTF